MNQNELLKTTMTGRSGILFSRDKEMDKIPRIYKRSRMQSNRGI